MHRDADKEYSVLDLEVREPHAVEQGSPGSTESDSPAAHPSDRLLIHLNAGWRVVDDDRQYVIQRRRGRARSRATGWIGRSFCRTREALWRCIRRYCGDLEPEAIAAIESLPLAKESAVPAGKPKGGAER